MTLKQIIMSQTLSNSVEKVGLPDCCKVSFQYMLVAWNFYFKNLSNRAHYYTPCRATTGLGGFNQHKRSGRSHKHDHRPI